MPKSTKDAIQIPSVTLLFEALDYWAARTPQATAIDEGARSVTYADYATRMRRIAATLHKAGVGRNDRVGLVLSNGIEACCAMMGALRNNNCFVPMIPTFPAGRLSKIFKSAAPTALITIPEHLPLVAEVLSKCASPPVVLVLDGGAGDGGEEAEPASLPSASCRLLLRERAFAPESEAPPSLNQEEDLAYIMYTSGTTGAPKGVMICHRAVLSTIRWGVDYFRITPQDRLSNHSRLSFDVSLFDIFCALLAGAALCPLTEMQDLIFPAQCILNRKITIWFSVPSAIGMMERSRQLQEQKFVHLRAALFAGEPLNPFWAKSWREAQPHIPIYNLYGPTEAAIVCTVHNVDVDYPLSDCSVPIGKSTRCAELFILRDNDEPAIANELGRLMIAGTQLANGYWREPEMTQRAFRANPLKPFANLRMYDTGDLAFKDENGIIHYVGRRDLQVKIRGYRIELTEIELALNAHEAVHDAVVEVVGQADKDRCALPGGKGPDEDKRLVAFVVPWSVTADAALEDELLDHLQQTLPKYMLPSRIIFMKEFPLNPNGKTDRAALRQLAL
jgi:amino acid adenylation domain-containing protein